MNTHYLALFTAFVNGLFGILGFLEVYNNEYDDWIMRCFLSAVYTTIAVSWWVYG